ncbi:nucleoside-binding protein [Colwellia sp. D2M02]|uniref:nucleoside-binding protein n=1 Tax=Colwellia sp. D2M02 TaxID=2841562 RepID=UPI001C0A2428|nr:nucleoside-binding protein [Colwellia sp. D2M02]MBU2894403.1 nucleoside-binding protein [Colwellia sp. D2M02]
MLKPILLTITLLAVLFNTASMAKTNWSSPSFTYLNGSGYELGDNHRQIITFEYASANSWGDMFLFMDRAESSNGDNSTYSEVSPRIHITAFELGVIENLYFTPVAEFGPETNWLAGLGTDLKIPYFQYAKLSLYYKDNGDGDSSEQLTLSWAIPLYENILVDGFIDVMGSYQKDNGFTSASSINATSQLKYNLASYLGLDTPLYVGIEYVHWNSKYGVAGVDERNVNALVKYHF